MLRVTVREDLTMEMASDLVRDLKTVIEWLDHHYMFTGEHANHRASRMKPRKDRTSRMLARQLWGHELFICLKSHCSRIVVSTY